MQEVKMICMQRLIKIDGKVRTDTHYPCGFMDVVEIEKRLALGLRRLCSTPAGAPQELLYTLLGFRADVSCG